MTSAEHPRSIFSTADRRAAANAAARSLSLRVLCEGATELNFVTQVLKPHLRGREIFVKPTLLPISGGGIIPWDLLSRSIKADIGRARRHQCVTTMIDLFRLPNDYPGAKKRPNESGADRAVRIETGMAQALGNTPNFIPYVQAHEFEAFVFVDLEQLPGQFPDGEAAGAPAKLKKAIGKKAPEDINDGAITAPSKRLIACIPEYEDRTHEVGPAIAAKIGLETLRARCPHFASWVTRLEDLGRN